MKQVIFHAEDCSRSSGVENCGCASRSQPPPLTRGRSFGVALKGIEQGQLVTLDDIRLLNQHVTVKD